MTSSPLVEAPVRAIPAGTILFRPTDECSGFVVVHQGSIRVSLVAENGREITLYRVRPGEICLQTFGCLVDKRQYSAEGVAETDLAIEIIPRAHFQQRIVEDATFRDQLFSAVSQRFADLEQLVEDVALTGFEARLARALLRLHDKDGRVAGTHEALAVETGTGRAAVSRQLKLFERDGLLTIARGSIHLLDPARLEGLAHPDL